METNTTTEAPANHEWFQCGVNGAAPMWMRILGLITSVLTISVGGIGNVTALVAFMTSRSLWQFSNINLFLLTIDDLIVTFFACPHYIVKYWLGCWPLSQYYCNIFMFFNGTAYTSSLILVALIAYERYLMVKLGALYRQHQSWKTVMLRSVPLAILVPCALVAVLCFTYWYQYFTPKSAEGEYIARMKCMPHMNTNGYFFASVSWASDLLPLLVMLWCYVRVYRRRSAWALKKTNDNTVGAASTTAAASILNTSTIKTTNQRAARLLNVMFATVLITQIPYMVMSFVTSLIMIGATPNLNRFYWVSLYELASLFAMLNNAANPLLYAYVMPDFDRAARDVWKPLWNGLNFMWIFINKKNS